MRFARNAARASAHVSTGYHPSAELAAEANFERYPALRVRVRVRVRVGVRVRVEPGP